MGVDVLIRESFSSALDMGGEVLKRMGFTPFEVVRILKHFKNHDEKHLEESYLYYKQEDQLINLSKKARFELERILKSDKKWISENKQFWD
jgi:hypothetical protein